MNVEISPQDVIIKAQTQHEHDERDVRIHQCESRAGQIFRMVHLPRPIDSARAYAERRNGVLSVTAPIARDGKGAEEKQIA